MLATVKHLNQMLLLYQEIYIMLAWGVNNCTVRAPVFHTQGSHKIWKQNSMTFPWLFHDWFAFFHDSHSHMVSDMVMIVSHNMHDNQKLEICHSHENKQFHDFSMTFWEIFISQDFFHDFPWQQFFSRIFHDRGNPAWYSNHKIHSVWKTEVHNWAGKSAMYQNDHKIKRGSWLVKCGC